MNITIIGAGIAGLSSAIALTQRGFTVSIYERRNSAANIGAGIVCWPNASFVLQELGVLEQVAKHAGKIVSMQRFDHQGSPLGKLDIQILNQKMGNLSYSITRYDIINILLKRALQLGVQIHFKQGVKTIKEQQNKASLLLENDQEVNADIIIGADGRMNSKARLYVNNENKPKFQHFINWIGIFRQPITKSPIDEQDALSETFNKVKPFDELSVCDYWGQGERFGIVPINSKQAYWAAGSYAQTIEKNTPEHFHEELLSRFSHWPGPIKQIIEATPVNSINKLYIHDHDPIDCWYKNNVLLIGDAAHAALPTSGQGACQALEDAWHLAQCLNIDLSTKQNKQNITDAFALFQKKRQEKTQIITQTGRHLAHTIFTPDKAHSQQRNESAKTTDYQKMANGMAQAWSQGLPLTSLEIHNSLHE